MGSCCCKTSEKPSLCEKVIAKMNSSCKSDCCIKVNYGNVTNVAIQLCEDCHNTLIQNITRQNSAVKLQFVKKD